MSSTVHKIELRPGLGHYSLPIDSELLLAGIQRGDAMLWYRRHVGTLAMEDRTILFVNTGREIADPPVGKIWKFISTMLTEDQSFVFHAFELIDDHG